MHHDQPTNQALAVPGSTEPPSRWPGTMSLEHIEVPHEGYLEESGLLAEYDLGKVYVRARELALDEMMMGGATHFSSCH